MRDPRLRPLVPSSIHARRAALSVALVGSCGDDVGDSAATTDAPATASASTSAAASTTNVSATGDESSTASATSGSGASETTSTTAGTSASSDASSSGESASAGSDTGSACDPGATESCYTGPEGTLDVGVCIAGTRTCSDEGTFGPCEGEVTPSVEDCGTPADEDCLGDVPECGAALWIKRFGGVASDESDDLAVGPDDGVVITGRFDAGSSISFGGATFNNKGSFDGYVASFESDGTHRWSHAFGSPSSDALRSVAVDSSGAVILSGDTQGAIDFGGGLLTSTGDQDVVVAKLDSEGAHLWSMIYKSPAQQVGLHCAVTSDDAVLLGGVFRGSVDFGGGAMASAGMNDIYLVKLDAAGKHLWSRRFGDADVDYAAATIVDASDAIVQAGYFAGSLDYGGGALVSAGSFDVFVAKLDDKGGHLWSKRFGDAGSQRVEGAAIAGDGRVLVGGSFNGVLDFGGDLLTSEGENDAFVAVFDADGGHLWSRRLHGPANDRVTALAADPDGNILVGGIFATSIDLGGAMLTAKGLYGSFLAKFDPEGVLLFSAAYEADKSTWITDVAVDSLGDGVIQGLFDGTLVIDGEPLMSAGNDDVFLAKIAP